MIVVVDSSALILLINPAANPPNDPTTGQPLHRARERIEHYLASMAPSDTIIIPTPVLAEALVKAGNAAGDIIAKINGHARLRVAPFDMRAAMETAAMTQDAFARGHKASGSGVPWQKVKVDRQIIAIARVAGSGLILADDHKLVEFARFLGMTAKSTWELDLPPEPAPDLLTGIGPHGAA